ncbi:MAG: hypothetical protein RIR26_1257 [Pseudomonadota bacterium]|jgi:MFS family permease
MSSIEAGKPSLFHRAVVVSALGYFVDIYDLILFSIVRKKSLLDIGVSDSRILDSGMMLLNLQMCGMLLGGLIWGILGDKRGRVSVLYGSILLYSLANLSNAFVQSEEAYGLIRFIAGIGLAGELGAAITLVSEVLGKDLRSAAAGVVAGFGLLGSVAAALIGEFLGWRFAYALGGGLGLILLFVRLKSGESEIFAKVSADKNLSRGQFLDFFKSRDRFYRYIRCIGLGVPVWLVVGIFATLAPDLALARGLPFEVKASVAVMLVYAGLALGDLASGVLSHKFGTRRGIIFVFMLSAFVLSLCHLLWNVQSSTLYYACFALMGAAVGYWAIFVLTTAETFGTNLRATATTTVPNFVRGSLVPMNLVVSFFAHRGSVLSGVWIATFLAFVCSFWSVWMLRDTHGRDLNFTEST